jgi:hypothetical protein
MAKSPSLHQGCVEKYPQEAGQEYGACGRWDWNACLMVFEIYVGNGLEGTCFRLLSKNTDGLQTHARSKKALK